MGCLDGDCAWDYIRDRLFRNIINEMDNMEDKLKYVKFLYLKDEEKYFKWKKWIIEDGEIPDVFGTLDNPIEIDESKL